MAYNPQNPNGQATSLNSAPVSFSTEQEAKIDLLATKAKQDILLAELQLKADLTETQPVSGAFFQATQPISNAAMADNTSVGTLALAAQTVVLPIGGKSAVGIVITGTWVGTITFEGTVDGTNWNAINAVAASTSTPQSTTVVNGLFRLTPAGLFQVRAIMTAFTSGSAALTMRASTGTGGIFANQIIPVTVISSPSSNLVATITAVSGAAVTLTIPAVVSQIHYITSLKIGLYSTAARVGAAAPIIVTTTNIPGALAFTFDTAGAVGTNIIQEAIVSIPLRSSVLNTATTIVCPIVTGGIWRITATYFTGA